MQMCAIAAAVPFGDPLIGRNRPGAAACRGLLSETALALYSGGKSFTAAAVTFQSSSSSLFLPPSLSRLSGAGAVGERHET